jgi:deazaflavin-dependent oxidoreductase (nitroreductase family)
MSATPNDFNTQVIEEFRANGGKAGGIFEGMALLLLHNVGAKSGERYVTPLVYMPDGERWVIFASKGGAPKNPGWYWNLKAGPDVSIEVGTEKIEVVASEATRSATRSSSARRPRRRSSPSTSRRPSGRSR